MTEEAGFGAFIKKTRLERGLSLRKASNQIGITHMRLDELERGVSRSTERPTRPRRELVRRIADAYGIPRDSLLELAGYSRERLEIEPELQVALDMLRRLDAHHRELAFQLIATVDRVARSAES